MNKFRDYISKVRSTISNPFNKIIDLLKNYNKISKLTEDDLKKTMPLSFKMVMDFKNNFKEAAIADMKNLDEKNKSMTGESIYSREDKHIYNEKLDIGTIVKIIPVSYFIFTFILMFGEETFEKMHNGIINFLDRTIGKHLDDPEIRAERERMKSEEEEQKRKKN